MAKRRRKSIKKRSSNSSVPSVTLGHYRTFGWLLVIVGLFLALKDLGILNLGLNIWTIVFLIFGIYFLSRAK